MDKKIVIASKNPGKIAEFGAILGSMGFELAPYEGPDIPETGRTFDDNARLKSEAVTAATGLPAIADDSGLCIHALSGEPGVESARYAAKLGGYPQAFEAIFKRLAGLERDAKFHASIALTGFGRVRMFEGDIFGSIAMAPRGESGFGYDPIFIPNGTGRTFAEMTPEEKNSISHRAAALEALGAFLASEIRRDAGRLKRESAHEEFAVEMERAGVQKLAD